MGETELLGHLLRHIESCFLQAFNRLISKERDVVEVGSIGSTFVFVLLGVSLKALGFVFNASPIELLMYLGAALGFLLFAISQNTRSM